MVRRNIGVIGLIGLLLLLGGLAVLRFDHSDATRPEPQPHPSASQLALAREQRKAHEMRRRNCEELAKQNGAPVCPSSVELIPPAVPST